MCSRAPIHIPGNCPSMPMTIPKAIHVGFWAQQAGDGTGLPWPQDAVDLNWDADEKGKVATYLKDRRFEGLMCRGFSLCRICRKVNGSADFGDGAYEWPEGFAHYVEAHSVRPPIEFVAHVLRHAA